MLNRLKHKLVLFSIKYDMEIAATCLTALGLLVFIIGLVFVENFV